MCVCHRYPEVDSRLVHDLLPLLCAWAVMHEREPSPPSHDMQVRAGWVHTHTETHTHTHTHRCDRTQRVTRRQPLRAAWMPATARWRAPMQTLRSTWTRTYVRIRACCLRVCLHVWVCVCVCVCVCHVQGPDLPNGWGVSDKAVKGSLDLLPRSEPARRLTQVCDTHTHTHTHTHILPDRDTDADAQTQTHRRSIPHKQTHAAVYTGVFRCTCVCV